MRVNYFLLFILSGILSSGFINNRVERRLTVKDFEYICSRNDVHTTQQILQNFGFQKKAMSVGHKINYLKSGQRGNINIAIETSSGSNPTIQFDSNDKTFITQFIISCDSAAYTDTGFENERGDYTLLWKAVRNKTDHVIYDLVGHIKNDSSLIRARFEIYQPKTFR